MIRGGGFSESGSASISGSGVMVYIAGSAYPAIGGTYGGISLSGAGTVNLSAPTTGAYAGIQFFQARTNPTGISISGSAAMSLGGVIYASDALLAASGSGSVITDGMVVNRIQLSGSAVASASVSYRAESVSVEIAASPSLPVAGRSAVPAVSQADTPPDPVLDELVAALLSSSKEDVLRTDVLGSGQSSKVAIARAGQAKVRSAKSVQASIPAGPLARWNGPGRRART